MKFTNIFTNITEKLGTFKLDYQLSDYSFVHCIYYLDKLRNLLEQLAVQKISQIWIYIVLMPLLIEWTSKELITICNILESNKSKSQMTDASVSSHVSNINHY